MAHFLVSRLRRELPAFDVPKLRLGINSCEAFAQQNITNSQIENE